MLRGACIGAGYFSRFHFDAWQRIDDVEIVGLCDLDKDKAAERAGEFGIDAVSTDVVQALSSWKPDFVDIITRPDTHAVLVELASRHCSAVICQKPLAPDFQDCRAIVESAHRNGARLMIHENFRFQPWYREIKRLLGLGTIGNCLHSITFRCRPGDGVG